MARRAGSDEERVTGMGEGASSFLNTEGTGERRAGEAAVRGIDVTLAVARVPFAPRPEVTP